MRRRSTQFVWREIVWQRPFEADAALALLTHIAAAKPYAPIAFEVRARLGKVRYLFGAEDLCLHNIKTLIQAEVPNAVFRKNVVRREVNVARKLKLSHAKLSLNTSHILSVLRSTLAALAQTKHSGDETVLQVILGNSLMPSLLPDRMPDPKASWLDILFGTVGIASSDSRRLLNEKANSHGFEACIRIGVASSAPSRCHDLAYGVFAGLKVAESAGAGITALADDTVALHAAKAPWHFPTKLTVKELLFFLCWPIGDIELPGVAGLHPKILLPPSWLKDAGRCFGKSIGNDIPLGISAKDSLEHTVILGPTGAGKSTVMLNLILQDVKAGRGVLLIDPKADLARDVLSRIPEERAGDVVVLDPSDTHPVGFNPLAQYRRDPALTADAVLSVFRDIFADSWGIRTQDILSGALLTLAQTKNASLVWLPSLLTDEEFRAKVTAGITDRLGLGAFWRSFEAMSKAERNQAIAPVLNKVRQFLLRPQLRAVLGQAEPKFQLSELFTTRRIVLVPLNKGLIGHESARLLGSLVVGRLWTLALSRAGIPPERRHTVNVYIDEVQDYLSLPTDLSDALAQARGLGVGLTLAHQYRTQLSPELKAAVDANARNKIVFGVNAGDARDMAAMAPGLDAQDFMLLPRYGIYANIMQGGKSTGWVSGTTLPPVKAIREGWELKARSMERYGRDAGEVERDTLAALGYGGNPGNDNKSIAQDTPIGRKKRGAE
jgi:hypothetical protein